MKVSREARWHVLRDFSRCFAWNLMRWGDRCRKGGRRCRKLGRQIDRKERRIRGGLSRFLSRFLRGWLHARRLLGGCRLRLGYRLWFGYGLRLRCGLRLGCRLWFGYRRWRGGSEWFEVGPWLVVIIWDGRFRQWRLGPSARMRASVARYVLGVSCVWLAAAARLSTCPVHGNHNLNRMTQTLAHHCTNFVEMTLIAQVRFNALIGHNKLDNLAVTAAKLGVPTYQCCRRTPHPAHGFIPVDHCRSWRALRCRF